MYCRMLFGKIGDHVDGIPRRSQKHDIGECNAIDDESKSKKSLCLLAAARVLMKDHAAQS